MFNFELKKAAVYQAVAWDRFFVFSKARIFKKIAFWAFIAFLAAFALTFFITGLPDKVPSVFLGLAALSLVKAFSFWNIETFFNSKIKKPKLYDSISVALAQQDHYNLADFFGFEVARAIAKTMDFARFRQLREANSTMLFYFLLIDNPKLNFVFNRAILNIKSIKDLLEKYIFETMRRHESDSFEFSETFQNVIFESLRTANKKQNERVEIGDTLTALAKCDPLFKKILVQAELKFEDIENLCWWQETIEKRSQKNKRFWDYDNLMRNGTLAKTWTAGYTVNLDKYSSDITREIKEVKRDFIGHETELKEVERVLSKSQYKNALLVGEPGTGRQIIVRTLAQKSLLGRSLPEINYKRVVELNLPSLLAQIADPELVESVLKTIFDEAVTAGNIILALNDFHNYIAQEPKPGIVDISGVLSSYLAMPTFQLVAITTYEGLHVNLEKNPSLLSMFGKIEVSEISERQTLMLLEEMAPGLERKYKKFISYPCLRKIIEYGTRYMPNDAFPEKALGLLDETAIYVSSATKDNVITPEHVANVVTRKTEIPVGQLAEKEKEVLLNLETLIHKRIVGQEEAVKDVATALRRARSDITVRKGPMGGFLFLGPTGVGKTETAKAIAEFYFGLPSQIPQCGTSEGGEERIVRIDMSEYQTLQDIPRLIGSEQEKGIMTSSIRDNPFTLLLLDEIEKAHPNILNLFLQVIDEGYLTDGMGRKLDFKNTIIIATSNAGYKIILEAIDKKEEWAGVKQKLLDFVFAEGIFRPEFINRFDAVVVFKPLTRVELISIAEMMLTKLQSNLKEKEIDFVITEPLKEKIAELGYSPAFGAREMRRVMQDKVENVLASALLSDQIKKGDRVEMDGNFKLKVK